MGGVGVGADRLEDPRLMGAAPLSFMLSGAP